METLKTTLLEAWQSLVASFPCFAAGLLLLVVVWIAAKLLDRASNRALQRTGCDYSKRMLFMRMIHVAFWVVGLLVPATVILPGLTVSRPPASAGVGSVAMSFAFKDIVENFPAGILILWRFPFDKGDFITCQDITGRVEEITIRKTLLRRVTGELVVMPNAMIFKNPVDVLTHDGTRQIRIIAGIGYDEDVGEARETIREAVDSRDSVGSDREIEVFVQEFGASSVNFEVAWWTDSTPQGAR